MSFKIGRSLSIFVLLLMALAVRPTTAWATPPLGDSDLDADVDLFDFARFANCYSGDVLPGSPACGMFDFSSGLPIGSTDFSLFSCGFSGPDVPVAAIIVDPIPTSTLGLQETLTGITAGAVQVQVTGGAQTVVAMTSGCDFQVQVPLRSNAVNRLYVSGLFNGGVASAPTVVAITQDSQAPSLFLDLPLPDAQIIAATTDIAGRVSDLLSGFEGLRVDVAVNDAPPVPAIIDIGVGANGTFFLAGASLNPGVNTIKVSSLDAVSNFTERSIQVTRVNPPAGAAQMVVFSGNAQSAAIHTVLPQPIQAKLLSAAGAPLEGKLVQFNVVRSDGRLGATAGSLLPGKPTLQVFTDAQGIATAFWRLGSDAGRGNNRVEVISDSVVGTTIFCASATPGPAAQINIGSGNNQRVEAGSPALEPLDVWVNDACNPVPGVDVTFMVRQGGGKIEGQDTVTLPTDSSGHVAVQFTLGPAAGNNVVEATFPGNPNPPAVFTLAGLMRNEFQSTSFSGLVLDNAGQPIQNATCALIVNGTILPFVQSDIDGRFLFNNLTLFGLADVHVAGASATHVGGIGGVDVPPNSFPSLRYSTVIVPNAENSLPTPVLLPRLDPANSKLYSTTQDTELTIAGMAGLKMVVKAGSMKIRSGNQFVPAPNGTVIALNQVHHDDVPMPLPDGAAPLFAWTLQPGGAMFNPPITVYYPNMSGLPAGTIANFLNFNHDTGRFEIIASGHVTADGTTIVTDPGAGITVAGWGCNCPPYSVTGQCCHCNEPCQTCVVGACVPTGNGVSCGGTCCASGESCCDGQCMPPGTLCCEGGSTCASDETCCGASCCLAGEECCENGCCRADEQCCGTTCISALNICCDDAVECFPEFPLCCGSGCCVSDGVCCNGECQIPGSSCCDDGRVCSPPTPRCCGDTCCAAGVECCDGVCAAPGAHCCDDANFCSGTTPQCCVEMCCAADAVCCNGACQPAGSTCCSDGAVCGADLPVCCQGECCEAGSVCCDDGCYPAGTNCCGESACKDPTPQCCGASCCGAADVCCGAVPCCPVGTTCCGDSACCSADEQCCDGACFPTTGGACCPGMNCPSNVCCGGNCCAADAVCCNGTCFPPGTGCCPNGTCSPPNSQCCGQTCCRATDACCGNGTCCGAGTTCCGADACCSANEICCQGLCVPPSGCCANGTCSPPNSQCCGDTCCGPTDVCCGDGTCCGAGTECCGAGGCCSASEVCCNGQCFPPGTGCCTNGTCSPPNSQCCSDTCCGPTDVCCGNGTCCGAGTVCCGTEGCCTTNEVCCNGLCLPPGSPCP